MARIRSIHPGQWTDEAFVSVSFPARLLFLALRTLVRRNEQFEWDAGLLKAYALPNDDVDVGALLEELRAAGLVERQDLGERAVGKVRRL